MSTQNTTDETGYIVTESIDPTLSTGWISVYRASHVPLPYAGGENR